MLKVPPLKVATVNPPAQKKQPTKQYPPYIGDDPKARERFDAEQGARDDASRLVQSGEISPLDWGYKVAMIREEYAHGQAVNAYHKKYGIPKSILADAKTPDEFEALVREYIGELSERTRKAEDSLRRAQEDESGANDVSLARPEMPPEELYARAQRKHEDALKETARYAPTAREREKARMRILKELGQRKPRSSKAKIW